MPYIFLIILIISFFQITQEIITQTLNPNQQFYSRIFSLNSLNNILNLRIQFQYTPLNYLNQINNFDNLQIDSQNMLTLLADKKIILLVCIIFDKEINLMVEIQQNAHPPLQVEFPLNSQNFEGQWHFLELYYNQNIQYLNITMHQNKNKSNILNQIYYNLQLSIDDYFTIEVGRNEQNNTSQQNQFQGLVIIIIIDDDLILYSDYENCQDLSSYQITEQAIFDHNQFLEHQILTSYSNCFGISSWIKINTTIQKEDIQILKIYSNPNKKNNETTLMVNMFYQLEMQTQFVNLNLTTYQFLHISQKFDYQSLQHKFEIDRTLLQNWHFLVLYYKDNQIKLSIQFPQFLDKNILKIIPNISFFSNLSLDLFFGGSYDQQSTTDGQFNLIKFYYSLDSVFPIQETCHYTCETCFGPFINQCLTCASFSHRELNLLSKCLCQQGCLELNKTFCQCSYQNGQIIYKEIKTQIGYDVQDENQVICSFGYFKYQDSCFKCPFLKKQYPCYLCLANPDTWIFEPKCLRGQFQKNQDEVFYSLDSAKVFLSNIYEIYLFSDEQLILCEYCESLCLTYPIDQYCFLSKYNHLGNPIYITCILGSIFQDGICKNIPENCLTSNFRGNEFVCIIRFTQTSKLQHCILINNNNECSQCIDQYKFYLTFDRLACLPCQIQYCKICFQYYPFDHRYTSLINLGLKLNTEDLVTGCAQCDQGYQFDFSIGYCTLILQSIEQCSKQYIDENQQLICFESLQDDFNKQKVIKNCQNYLYNCLSCISPKIGQYYCIQCKYGFYFQLQLGICLKCQDYDQNFISCQEVLYDQQLTILQKVIGFLFTFSNVYPVNSYFSNSYISINPTKCQQGLIPYNDYCLQYSDDNCKIYQDTKCIQCLPNEYGIRRLTLINQKCVECPFYCEYCQKRTNNVMNINIYYNQSTFQDQYQCLQLPPINNLFIDNRIGLVKNCKGTLTNCQIELYFYLTNLYDFYSLFYKPLQFDKDFLILIGVNQIKIDFQASEDLFYDDSFYTTQQNFNQFSNLILGLQSVEIIIVGVIDTTTSIIFGRLEFINFQSITFQNLSVNFSVYCDSQLNFKSLESKQIILKDVIISDTYVKSTALNYLLYEVKQHRKYQLYIQNPAVIKLFNLIIQNMTIYNTSFFYFQNINEVILDQLVIDQLLIVNCTFMQSNFLEIITKISYHITIIQKLNIFNCSFFDSTFLNFENLQNQGQLIISEVVFQHVIFQNSNATLLPNSQSRIEIQQFQVLHCNFNQSVFIQLQSDAKFFDINISNSIMFDTILIKFKFSHNKKSQIHIQQLKCEMISYLVFILILNDSNKLQEFYINSVYIQQMISLNTIINQQYFLFQLTGETIFFSDSIIQKLSGSADFNVQNFQQVKFKNMTIHSQIQEGVNQIFVISSTQVQITDLEIYNLKLIDVVMIEILETIIQQNSVIYFENIRIQNITIKKIQTNFAPTLIQIINSQGCEVNFFIARFESVWENQYTQDPEINSASLLMFDIPLSKVILKQIKIFNCLITNSSDSLILIKSNQLEIAELITNYTNDYFYYQKQQPLNQVIDIQLKSFARLCFIQTIKAKIYACQFFNGIGYDGGIFYILTQLDSILNFHDLVFENININNSYQTSNTGGCFYILAENSNLRLKMNNLDINRATSSYQAGFLYIKGSNNFNQILLQNIKFQEVFSYSQSILSFLCNSDRADSSVELRNFTIINSKFDYQQYQQINIDNLNNYPQKNLGQITIIKSQVKISNLNYQGFAHESIIYISYNQILRFDNIYLNQVQFEGSSQLIYIEDISALFQSAIIISSFYIMNSSILSKADDILSFVEIHLSSFAENIKFNQLLIYNNTCQFCQLGILHFITKQTSIQKQYLFDHVILLKNNCGNSCIYFEGNSTNALPQIKIVNSNIISNKAVRGNILVVNFNMSISNTNFAKNLAQLKGGSIEAQTQEHQKLTFQNVYFMENQAQVGGSLFLSDNSFITRMDSIYNINNKARNYSNNIAEQPSYLNLLLNGDIIQNLQISKKFYAADVQMLYFPSGITLRDYQIFDYTSFKYLKYKSNLYICAYNKLMEQIDDLYNSCCIITLKIKSSIDAQYMQILTNQTQVINFDIISKCYDLNDLQIILNPYQKFSYLEVNILCNSTQQEYNLIFKVSTFKCQIGEYFYMDQCIRCQSSAGYYSATNNSTSCKRIDIKMINQTDGAMLQLQPRFWRPHIRSDLIEECQNYPKRCLGGWIPGDNSCQLGAIGALCEDCDIYNIRGFGKFLNDRSSNCKICGNTFVQIMFLLISLLWTTLLIVMTIKSTENTQNRLTQLKLMFRKYQTLFKFSLDQTSILIKMANNYIQILTIIYSFRTDIFADIKDVFRFFGENSNIAIYQIDCQLSSYFSTPIIYIHLIALILIPFFSFSITSIVYFFGVIVSIFKYSQIYVFTAVIYIYIQNQQIILNNAISLISKRNVSGSDFIQVSLSNKYFTEEHFNWSTRFICPIILFLGFCIPISIFLLLNKNKALLYQKKQRAMFSYLINEYSDKCYYWEIIRIFQKLFIVFTTNFFEQFFQIKAVLLIICIIVYCQLLQIFQPYRQTQFNTLDFQISFNILIVLLLLILLEQQKSYQVFNYQQFLEFTILLYILQLCVRLIAKIFKALFTKFKESLDPFKKMILQQFPQIKKQFPSLKSFLVLRSEQKIRIYHRFNQIKLIIKEKQSRNKESFSQRNQFSSHRSDPSILLTVENRDFYSHQNSTGRILRIPTEIQSLK